MDLWYEGSSHKSKTEPRKTHDWDLGIEIYYRVMLKIPFIFLFSILAYALNKPTTTTRTHKPDKLTLNQAKAQQVFPSHMYGGSQL